MENIIEPSDKFDFSKLNLENPVPLQGGNFFTKLNFTEKQLPLLVQLPKCSSKHGLVKSQSNKKMYIDLLFNYFVSPRYQLSKHKRCVGMVGYLYH